MNRLTGLAAALALVGTAAQAQPVTSKPDTKLETVIVTAPRLSDEVKATIHNFVATFAAPAPLSGEITRWDSHEPLCPETYGFTKASDNVFVTSRIRQIAAQVGAPVKPAPCFPTLEVYFAANPQQLLDAIREHGGSQWLTPQVSRAKEAAVFAHPIQAWYVTLTRDDCGILSFDNDNGWDGTSGGIGCSPQGQGVYAVAGSRVRTALQSVLGHVYIVVDVNKTSHISFQAVADYVALLALSRTEDFETCQPLPSIANLMSANCDAARKTGAMTATDLAYLTGIYSMDAGANLAIQQSTISAKIESAMTGQQ